MKKYVLYKQAWLESERGWGQRSDGYSLHRTLDDCGEYIRDYWAEMPDETPDEYSRPIGSPELIEVTKAEYDSVKGNGRRVF